MEKKLTKVEMFNKVLEVVKDNEDLKIFIEREIELLNNRNKSKSKKVSAEIEKTRTDILEAMSDGKKYRANDIAKILDISPQKVVGNLNKMENIYNEKIKGVSWFSIEPIEEN